MRNLKQATDDALAPDLASIDELENEEQELALAQVFTELIRLKNMIATFADITFEDIKIDDQGF